MPAIVGTNVLAGVYDNTDVATPNPYSSASTFTMKVGHLYVASIAMRGGVFDVDSGFVNTSPVGTWNTPISQAAAGVAMFVGLHWAVNTSGANYTGITLQIFSSHNATGCAYVVTEFSNVDMLFPVIQTSAGAASGVVTSVSTSAFGQNTRADGMIVSAASVQQNEAMSAKSGYTSAAADKANGTGPACSIINQYKLSPDTDQTCTATWTTLNAQACIVAMELQNARYPRVMSS